MKAYEISFSGWRDSSELAPRDLRQACTFCIKIDEVVFNIPVRLSSLLAQCWGLKNDKEKYYVLQIGLSAIKMRLRTLEPPKQSTQEILFEIPLTTETQPDRLPVFRKECQFQKRSKEGYFCTVLQSHLITSGITKSGPVSPYLCDICNLPDDSLRCSHLSHPIISHQIRDLKPSVKVWTARCDFGKEYENNEVFDFSKCIPGERDCWRQILEVPEPEIRISDDLPERASDEIDHLNTLFKSIYGKKILEPNFTALIATLFGLCNNQGDFTFKVAAVGSLIERINLDNLLVSEEKGLVGSLNKLEAFLKRNHPTASVRPVEILKQIIKIRNSFPTHPAVFPEAFRCLGIKYPLESWNTGWQKVLYWFWWSLRELRRIIQFSEKQETNSNSEVTG